MTFDEAYTYLLERLPMFQRIGKAAYKKDIGNIIALCEALDDPQHTFRSIHVAGTNGKGSVSSMLSAILTSAGYKTGLYTSPHLKSFTERIRINGNEISGQYVADFVEKNASLFEAVQPSYFEVTVAMAFDFFAKEAVDIAVVEVGLGGRLDSTNILNPELCAITNIGWDHMNILGDTLEKIATEKAGIIKDGVSVVIGETQEAIAQVFLKKAAEHQAPITFADQVLPSLKRIDSDWEGQRFDWSGMEIYLDLAGSYQTANLKTALQVVKLLREQGWVIPDKALQEGLAHVKKLAGLRGRMEVIQRGPLILTDTAHNKDGLQEVLAQVQADHSGPLGIVLGVVSDKDLASILNLFPKNAQYFFVKPNVPRGLEASELYEQAKIYGLYGKHYTNVEEGLAALKAWLPADGRGFVGGSTFTVAEVV
jgi:dihydrofolate synthase/folylpolyglutamate synthase